MIKKFPQYQIDAFTDELFKGNPAAVVVLDDWLDNSIMQNIAMENNLSETAFIIPRDGYFDITWFTPISEIDLCGHATLSAAHVIFNHLDYNKDTILFKTRQVGDLGVKRGTGLTDDIIYLNFPIRPPEKSETLPDNVITAVHGAQPTELYGGQRYMIVYSNSNDIKALKVNFDILNHADHSLITTAPASADDDCDYVYRYFCAGIGIGEDPVTGSAQCVLIPYWAERLGKTKMISKQLSTRGGTLYCELKGDRVEIGGKSKTFLEGHIFVDV